MSAINSNTNTLGVNASLSGSTVWIVANSVNTQLTVSVAVKDAYAGYSNDPFPTPSFPAGTTQSYGGTNAYDTGSVTVTLTSTSGDSYGSRGWRSKTPYGRDKDFVFSSLKVQGAWLKALRAPGKRAS